LVEDASTARASILPQLVRRGGHLFAAREAAGWHERRHQLADLPSECRPAAERLSETPAPRDPLASCEPASTGRDAPDRL
jgi:hypothetical protein